MGYSPQQVNAMSIWQFRAVVEGFKKSQAGSDKQLSEDDRSMLWDWLNADRDPVTNPQPVCEFDPSAVLPVEAIFNPPYL